MTLHNNIFSVLILMLAVSPFSLCADEPPPAAELIWQSNGESIDLLLRLNGWQEGLEGFNVNRGLFPQTAAHRSGNF